MKAILALTLSLVLLLPGLAAALGPPPMPQDDDEGPPFCSKTHCGWYAAGVPFGIQQNEPRLNAVAYATSNQVATVGFGGTIMYSTNGGRNWTQVPSPLPNATMNTLLKLPSGLLLAAGDGGAMIASEDGGQSWYNYAPSGIRGNVTEMGFLNLFWGWASTTSGLFVSTNAGVSWTQVSTPVSGQVLAAGFYSSTQGWIDAGLTPNLYYTETGGSNWTQVEGNFGNLYVSSIQATGPGSAWVLSDTGIIFKINGEDAQSEIAFDVDLEDLGANMELTLPYAWMVASLASIFYTSDNGQCWTQEAVPNEKFVYDVAFANSTWGVASGDGFVWWTTSGGLSANDSSDDDIPGCDVEPPPRIPGWVAFAGEGAAAGVALAVCYWVFLGPRKEKGPPPPEKAVAAQRSRLKVRERKRYVEFH